MSHEGNGRRYKPIYTLPREAQKLCAGVMLYAAAAAIHRCQAVDATPCVVCSCHVLMFEAWVLMGWHQQQCSYNIITPREEHKAHQSIGATSTRIAGQSAQSSPALWKANKAASSNKPQSLNSARPNGFDMLKAKTQTRTIAAHRTRRC